MISVETIVGALTSLGRHKLRSFLTMLGMIFGVGAVIAMLSIGAGAESESLRVIESFGISSSRLKNSKPKNCVRSELNRSGSACATSKRFKRS